MGLVDGPKEGSAEAVEAPASDMPEQFRGKQPEELVSMYQSLEKKLGQQSEELGSLRSLAEQQLLQPQASSQSVTEDYDFYADPEATIERIVAKRMQPLESVARAQTVEQVQRKLAADFPDWENTVADEGFQEWVGKSKVRVDLFRVADSGNFDAAAELFSTWGELNEAKSTIEGAKKKAVSRDRNLRAATTEKGSAGIDPRKILNRSDLRTLRQTNPTRYRELEPDIMKAYSEGRVR